MTDVRYPTFFHYWLVITGLPYDMERLYRSYPFLRECIDLGDLPPDERADLTQILRDHHIHFTLDVITKEPDEYGEDD